MGLRMENIEVKMYSAIDERKARRNLEIECIQVSRIVYVPTRVLHTMILLSQTKTKDP